MRARRGGQRQAGGRRRDGAAGRERGPEKVDAVLSAAGRALAIPRGFAAGEPGDAQSPEGGSRPPLRQRAGRPRGRAARRQVPPLRVRAGLNRVRVQPLRSTGGGHRAGVREGRRVVGLAAPPAAGGGEVAGGRSGTIRLATGASVERLQRELALHPTVARLLVQRGLAEPAAAGKFLNPSLDDLHDPSRLADLESRCGAAPRCRRPPGADRRARRLRRRRGQLHP